MALEEGSRWGAWDDRDGVGRTLIYKQEPGSNPSSAFRNGVALSESLPS